MQHKPKWRLLYAILPLSAGLLWLDGRLTFQLQAHQLLETGIVLISFGLMALWVRANRTAAAEESTAHVVYWAPSDPHWDRAPDSAPRATASHSMVPAEMDRQTFGDLKGRYN